MVSSESSLGPDLSFSYLLFLSTILTTLRWVNEMRVKQELIIIQYLD